MCSQHSRYTTSALGSHFSSYAAVGMCTVQVFRIRRPRPYLQQTLQRKPKQIRILTQITLPKICKIMQNPDPKKCATNMQSTYHTIILYIYVTDMQNICKTLRLHVDLLHLPVSTLDLQQVKLFLGLVQFFPLSPQKNSLKRYTDIISDLSKRHTKNMHKKYAKSNCKKQLQKIRTKNVAKRSWPRQRFH